MFVASIIYAYGKCDRLNTYTEKVKHCKKNSMYIKLKWKIPFVHVFGAFRLISTAPNSIINLSNSYHMETNTNANDMDKAATATATTKMEK